MRKVPKNSIEGWAGKEVGRDRTVWGWLIEQIYLQRFLKVSLQNPFWRLCFHSTGFVSVIFLSQPEKFLGNRIVFLKGKQLSRKCSGMW